MIEYYDVSGCYILRPWSFKCVVCVACVAVVVVARLPLELPLVLAVAI